jgi:hypothetical protein
VVLNLFRWMEATPLAVAIQSSTYLFPLIEVAHLLGLTLLYGAILLVDLKLLGVPIQRQPVSRLAAQVNPFASLGLAIMVLTGVPLMVSEAIKCYDNPAFWFKMTFLFPAVVFHFTARRHVLKRERGRAVATVTALASLLLWFCVGAGGRAIAFV